jgi:phosphocarrier protein
MVRAKFTIKDKAGLHARPASILCNIASKYSGDIDIIYNDKKYTLKSIMIIMSLGIPYGSNIILEAKGENETQVINDLTKVLHENNLV